MCHIHTRIRVKYTYTYRCIYPSTCNDDRSERQLHYIASKLMAHSKFQNVAVIAIIVIFFCSIRSRFLSSAARSTDFATFIMIDVILSTYHINNSNALGSLGI